MQELSLNVLDVAQNAISAQATLVEIRVARNSRASKLSISIIDNGVGMDSATLEAVTNPFFTTRTTRKVGLGVPFFKMSAELTGGSFVAESTVLVGTKFVATYKTDHIDCAPLGDMVETMVSLICFHKDVDFLYEYRVDQNAFVLDSREIKEILGAEVPLDTPEVMTFLKEYIEQQSLSIAVST